MPFRTLPTVRASLRQTFGGPVAVVVSFLTLATLASCSSDSPKAGVVASTDAPTTDAAATDGAATEGALTEASEVTQTEVAETEAGPTEATES